MRAVIYARVSSLAQKDRHTIASQLRVLPEFVASRGWQLVRPPETYVDDGKSAKAGKLDRREAFTRLLHDAGAGEFDVVCVVDLDRLTRSEDLAERGAVLGAFQKAGVQIAVSSTGQVLDLRSSLGDLMSSLGTFFAAEENRKRAERIKRGKVEALRKGKKPAGPTPFGYLYSRETGAWSVDPQLGPVVVEIYERVASGETCEAIARDLQTRGVPRARPSKTGNRKPGRWNRERVWQLVRATTYRGEWVADKAKGYKLPVPRIVSDELWRTADEALQRYGLRGMNRTRHLYLAQGISRCALCGAPIGCASAYQSKEQGRVFYYVCSRRRRPDGGPRCTLPMRRSADVDARIWAKLCETLLTPGLVEEALAQRRTGAERDGKDWRKDLRTFERKLEQLEQDEVTLMERFRRRLVSQRAMDAALEQMARERALLERQVESAKRRSEAAGRDEAEARTLLDAVEALRRRLPGATPEQRRELVRALVPGRGDAWVVLDARDIELNLVLAEQPTAQRRIAQVDAAG